MLSLLLWARAGACSSLADDRAGEREGSAGVSYEQDVVPVLREHCWACHGDHTQESELRLDSLTAALRGGDSGEPTIVPGDSRRSHLIERITSEDVNARMPPEAPSLTPREIELLSRWIDDAPLWSEAQRELADPKIEHWSFRPVVRPPIPAIEANHPLDAFVNARLAEAGLSSSPRAERQRLIRRLFLVMLGLPPSPEQIESFLSDQRPDAWLRLIDRVLASPRYGERWATSWLDLVHFGETNGFETNRERPTAYPYRDWVIAASNADKAYDVFIKQQIAGDVLGEPVAVGFLVAGPHDIVKGQDALLGLTQRQDELTDMVNTVGTAFLGLTTGCARCHNHKFDPISQSDFYAMQAVFAGVEHGERELPLSAEAELRAQQLDSQIATLRGRLARLAGQRVLREKVNPRHNIEELVAIEAQFIRFTIDATNGAEPCLDELQIFSADKNVALAEAGGLPRSSGDFVHPLHKLQHINDGRFGNSRSWIASTKAGAWVEIELPRPRRIDRIVWGRDRQGKYADRLAIKYRIEASLDGRNWQLVASSKDRVPPDGPAETAAVDFDTAHLSASDAALAQSVLAELRGLEKERAGLVAATQVYAGNFHPPPVTHRLYRGDPAAPREVVPPGAIAALGKLDLATDAREPERRLALAQWIARADNPLTARVISNRLWQFHFGAGIVDTPSDFGINGTRPTHPELLEWLATEFVRREWSLKQLHRLVLTSDTWQQNSRGHSAGLEKDAQSRLLWRFPPRRLEAEGIRDSMLSVAGTLDLASGGPGFSAFEVTLENVRHYFPKQTYDASDWRRMIYMTKVRQEKDSTFGLFDCPDGSQVTPRRSRSTTPLQALNLLNSSFVNQQAELFAQRLAREAAPTPERISRAYMLAFGRLPGDAEVADAAAFVELGGWKEFARAIFNANEFVFIP